MTSPSLGDGQREAARARTRRSTFAKCRACGGGASIANYDVTSGGRFIMIRRGANGGKLRVVLNWTDELKRILAAGGAQ